MNSHISYFKLIHDRRPWPPCWRLRNGGKRRLLTHNGHPDPGDGVSSVTVGRRTGEVSRIDRRLIEKCSNAASLKGHSCLFTGHYSARVTWLDVLIQ